MISGLHPKGFHVHDAIGFIGTGHIAAAVVEGLVTAPGPVPRICVSPRNAQKAAELAKRFATVTVAPDNQAVIDRSRTVFLSVRPQVALDVIRALKFAAGQTIVSLIPLPLSGLAPLVAPAGRFVRALPLPPCARRHGAVPYWPPAAEVHDLLTRLGPPLPLSAEHDLNVLWAATAMIAPYYALLETVSDWCVARGAAPDTAADYTAAMFNALAGAAVCDGPGRFSHLAAAAATPGGLNEQAVGMIRQGGAFARVREALDAIFLRLTRPPTTQ
jgi:pyrroline-5-carboxylate reductase